jgi:hypothetical protein
LAQFSAFVLQQYKHVRQIYTACKYFHASGSRISSVKTGKKKVATPDIVKGLG